MASPLPCRTLTSRRPSDTKEPHSLLQDIIYNHQTPFTCEMQIKLNLTCLSTGSHLCMSVCVHAYVLACVCVWFGVKISASLSCASMWLFVPHLLMPACHRLKSLLCLFQKQCKEEEEEEKRNSRAQLTYFLSIQPSCRHKIQ